MKRLKHPWAFVLFLITQLTCNSSMTYAGTLRNVATYRGIGGVLNARVGPGPAGSERYYVSLTYTPETLELLAINPDNGQVQVYPNPPTPEPREAGAWAVVTGPDNLLYLGTQPGARLFRLDPNGSSGLEDLGKPSVSESDIWQLAVGSDQKIYGCTFPHAKLIRYTPSTQLKEDLGRMDNAQKYARYVAASNDGFVYVGIGSTRAAIVAYEIATGQKQDITIGSPVVGFGVVVKASDGKVYARVGSQVYSVNQWTLTPRAGNLPAEVKNRFSDGRTIAVDTEAKTIRVTTPGNPPQQFPLNYTGRPLSIFRLGTGPDQRIYGSGVIPGRLLQVNPQSSQLSVIGPLGQGEVYTFLKHGSHLLAAGYGTLAPLMRYDPALPYSASNPMEVHFSGEQSTWRPHAMITGPDNRVYVGALAGYGRLGGPLTIWNPANDQVKNFDHLITSQSVVALTFSNGLLVGGTSIKGGSGTTPTETQAKLFLWDPVTETKLMEAFSVPGVNTFNNFITTPDGLVFGFADRKLFTFDVLQRSITYLQTIPTISPPVYGSLTLGPDGRVWGISAEGLFTIDPVSKDIKVVVPRPGSDMSGMALQGNHFYFASDCTVYEYSLDLINPTVDPPLVDTRAAAPVSVYPNPWDARRHAGLALTFSGIPPEDEVKIFNIAGQWVNTLRAGNLTTPWNLTNSDGERVASGLYFFTAHNVQGQKSRGTFAVIR